MRPLKPEDPKKLVAKGYDRCAAAYSAARSESPPQELVAFADRLPQGSSVLDIGCGAGRPVTRYLSGRCRSVTGVDISASQIALARENAPAARLIHGDIMAQRFAPATFDAIVMVYTLFHLPRSEHESLIRRMRIWLKDGGLAFVTVAADPEEMSVEEDFFGSRMYWSSLGSETYRSLFAESGFRVLEAGTLGSGFSDALDLPQEVHPFFVLGRVAAVPD